MVFTTLAVRMNSPFKGRPSTSKGICWVRSPFATAPITRAISVDGCIRSVIRPLTPSIIEDHAPPTLPRLARWLIFPSFPTPRLIRSSSIAMRSLRSITSFRAS